MASRAVKAVKCVNVAQPPPLPNVMIIQVSVSVSLVLLVRSVTAVVKATGITKLLGVTVSFFSFNSVWLELCRKFRLFIGF